MFLEINFKDNDFGSQAELTAQKYWDECFDRSGEGRASALKKKMIEYIEKEVLTGQAQEKIRQLMAIYTMANYVFHGPYDPDEFKKEFENSLDYHANIEVYFHDNADFSVNWDNSESLCLNIMTSDSWFY